jgi:DNA-binding transcriptional MerR regulator
VNLPTFHANLSKNIDSNSVDGYTGIMQEQGPIFSIETLAEQTGISVRTIRFYIAEGLLSGPGARGKGASYTDEHLLRLRLIRQLSEQRVPLTEMRHLLTHLSREEVQGLLAEEEQRALERANAAQSLSPKEYIETLLEGAQEARQRRAALLSNTPPAAPALPLPSHYPPRWPASPGMPSSEVWERWELAPGVELHVRADLRDRYRHMIKRLFESADEERR